MFSGYVQQRLLLARNVHLSLGGKCFWGQVSFWWQEDHLCMCRLCFLSERPLGKLTFLFIYFLCYPYRFKHVFKIIFWWRGQSNMFWFLWTLTLNEMVKKSKHWKSYFDPDFEQWKIELFCHMSQFHRWVDNYASKQVFLSTKNKPQRRSQLEMSFAIKRRQTSTWKKAHTHKRPSHSLTFSLNFADTSSDLLYNICYGFSVHS